MPQRHVWRPAEFERLLRSTTLSDAELAAVDGRHSAGAIGAMRDAIHKYHTRGNAGTFCLAVRQMAAIEERRGQWRCHRCGEPF